MPTSVKSADAVASPIAQFSKLLKNKKSEAEARQVALKGIRALFGSIENEGLLVIEALPALLAGADDKAAPVRELVNELLKELVGSTSKWGTCTVVDTLLLNLADEIKWRTKVAALELLSTLAQTRPKMVALCLPNIIPVLNELVFAIKKEVKAAAEITLDEVVKVVENRDIADAIPAIVKALRNPEDAEETIHILASTTFVADVYASALSIILPLLIRGFSVNKTAVRRQCSVIISNMYKLVNDPVEGAAFLPQLLPVLEKMTEEISDPEARAVATRAYEQICRIRDAVHGRVPSTEEEANKMTEAMKKVAAQSANEPQALYAAKVAGFLSFARHNEAPEWTECVTPLLTFSSNAAALTKDLLALCSSAEDEEEDDADEDAEELCNCKFTLAYGTKVLLHNTQLKLKRGYRYGLVGQNDSGKSTLMRSMANGQLEGFPTDLRTVFVEADIQGEMSHLSVLDYVFTDEAIVKCGASREDVAAMLTRVQFTAKMQADPITSLSGGWRMKLALARAMLQKADILLLDEPTNHLDVINVAWVKQYLNSLKDVTSIMVSHDTGLLNDCATHVLQIDNLKLNLHKGNLDAFIAKVPRAKAFFELQVSSTKSFKFPSPGYLEGVKSKGKALMKMNKVTFAYPGNDKPTVSDVTVQVSLSSRVACVGVNGAGKSTVIKLLTGEMEPTSGTVWKHAGSRIAYVAQHAFHHIETHLTKSANEYIRWRYQFGEDREGLEKVTMVLTPEEEAAIAKPIPFTVVDEKGNNKTVKKIMDHLTGNRRNGKKGFEYEIHWKDTPMDANTWMSGDKLETLGFTKLVKQADSKAEARERMYSRPLTSESVEKHLVDIGLAAEYATHSRMSALSGGQKVKVVIAAAMWNQPHIVILDEPTNYLDRESLSALAGAIQGFEGGVVIISHNDQFCTALCPEVWVVEGGKLDCKGDPEWMKNAASQKTEFEMIDEMVDGNGNVVKVKQAKKKELSRKEKKQLERRRKAMLERGEVLSDDEDDFFD